MHVKLALTKNVAMKTNTESEAQLESFWKVAQSLQEYLVPWLADKENLGVGTTKTVNFGNFSMRFHLL